MKEAIFCRLMGDHMKNSQEKAERIESVRDFLRLVDQMSKTSYFYLTEDQDNQEYVPDPTCPDFIKNMIGEFLSGSKIAEIPCESGIHYILKFGIILWFTIFRERKGTAS